MVSLIVITLWYIYIEAVCRIEQRLRTDVLLTKVRGWKGLSVAYVETNKELTEVYHIRMK